MNAAQSQARLEARRAAGPDIATLPRWLLIAGLALALAIGVTIRLYYVFRADFPLHDGGLFLIMMRDLQANDFRLPQFTSYNGGGIPFAYPPLGLYAAAALDRATPLDPYDVLRYLPLTVNVATILAFALLARTVLLSQKAALAAIIAFAMLPRSSMWMIMGGGITRAFGFLFAILALQQAYLLFTRRDRRFLPLSVVFTSLTVLSHTEMTIFLGASLAIIILVHARNRASAVSAAMLGIGALMLSSSWWGAVLANHGMSTLLAPVGSRPIFQPETVNIMARFDVTNEIFFPLLAFLGALGIIVCVGGRRFFLPAWLLLIGLPAPWVIATQAVVPLALLVGIGVTELLLPLLAGVGTGRRRNAGFWLQVGAPAFVIAYTLTTALVARPPVLTPLPERQRDALAWVAESTPDSSRFLIIEAEPWWGDKISEWFPALTGRTSVATPQGLEWAERGTFRDMIDAYEDAQACSIKDFACLQKWSQETGIGFTHIYVSKRKAVDPEGEENCCWALRNSLYGSPAVRIIYDGPAATIAETVGGQGG